MTEGAPRQENIKSRKELFKLLYRKVHGLAHLDAQLPENLKIGKHNTAVALNLLTEFVDNNQPLPASWDGMTLSATTPFFFIRLDDGNPVYNVGKQRYATPTELITALQRFYKLDQLTITEVQAELEAARAAEEAEEKAKLEQIRSGQWVKDRMPEPIEPEAPEPLRITPRRPSAFRPHG